MPPQKVSHTVHRVHVEVREQLCGVSSCLPSLQVARISNEHSHLLSHLAAPSFVIFSAGYFTMVTREVTNITLSQGERADCHVQ